MSESKREERKRDIARISIYYQQDIACLQKHYEGILAAP